MKKILLIDADSTIPNLALMKISTHYKNKDYLVDLIKLEIPYYKHRIKKEHNIDEYIGYDKKYCSVIFDGSIQYIKGTNINFGGTGFSLHKDLPDKIEYLKPDYSLYPDNDVSYGFISRGCIRNCYFCKVPEKEGKIRQVNKIEDIIFHKKIKFLDNNFLALPNHIELLEELVEKKIKCQFNQGLDIRLINESNSILLSKLKYINEYIFAFDAWNYRKNIIDKLKILKWRKDWNFKFFVYIHPNMVLSDTINRINMLKEYKCLPYIMRDMSCWDSEYSRFYVDLAAWCNQPNLFKTMDFNTFLNKRHKNKERMNKHIQLYKGV